MSNMQVFYRKVQATTPEISNPYLATLKKLTNLDVAQMESMVSNLLWVDWGAPAPASLNH